MFDTLGQVRPGYAGVHEAMAMLSPAEVRARADYLSRTYVDQGVTFDIGGQERPFPLDLVPRLIDAQTWTHIELGVAQRVRALERFLADVYGPGDLFADGVVPREVVTSSAHFHRVVAGLDPPGGVRIHVAGIDLVRDDAGTFRVLEDNVRIPSGVSYVMTNRRAVSSVLPEAFAHHRVQPVRSYPHRLLAALRAAAPSGANDPTVVVLSPGVYNSAYFEHALLARMMGCRLVEGRDILCQGGRVLVRTTSGLRPVHVVYRRVDDEWLDPMHFRGDSLLGCAGMVNAARAGNVTIANAVGNGVADDKLVYTYVPDLIRYYLGEAPILPNVDTWRLGDPAPREEVLDRLAEVVVKPVDGSGGKGILIGPDASPQQLDQARRRIVADPRGWVAQPVVTLSTVPTFVDGQLAPRHVDLRPFAVNSGEEIWVLPGGLTRVALAEGQLVVNSSQGGGSKDTWVLAGPNGATSPLAPRRRVVGDATGRASARAVGVQHSEVAAYEHAQQVQQQGRVDPQPLCRPTPPPRDAPC
ncbi:MAG: circularly permuted type 2 ATP-grasp protein [Dermatophilaceae bacterium]